tara:strand:+ start:1723 stop:1899 length:177 start_codon:yes stop_codon:yes gene_type:complete
MKIKTEKIEYYGYKQGYKIYINNKKYPVMKNYFYTDMNKNNAIKQAINDHLNKIINYK